MSDKHHDADLILKLYDLRREAVMRKAREWFIGSFHPESLKDFQTVFMNERGAYYRQVTTYWDMAASLVNNGALDEQIFNDANGEHVVVFAKVEPFLAEIRSTMDAPTYLEHLERLVMRLPDAATRLPKIRERMKQFAAMRTAAASEPETKEAAGSAAA